MQLTFYGIDPEAPKHVPIAANFRHCGTAFKLCLDYLSCHTKIIRQVHVERVDFLEPRVPQEEWTSVRAHSVVGPEAAGIKCWHIGPRSFVESYRVRRPPKNKPFCDAGPRDLA